MSLEPLENLVTTGDLKREATSDEECRGLMQSGVARLKDARNDALSLQGRFDLAYNAAHALSLAALRRLGYRSSNRYLVFQALEHTAGIPPSTWRVLAKAHAMRNQSEYEGVFDVDPRLLADVIDATQKVLDALGPPPA